MTLKRLLSSHRGAAADLARRLGVSEAIVSLWASGRRRIPAEQCALISRLTKIPRASLRPDLFKKTDCS